VGGGGGGGGGARIVYAPAYRLPTIHGRLGVGIQPAFSEYHAAPCVGFRNFEGGDRVLTFLASLGYALGQHSEQQQQSCNRNYWLNDCDANGTQSRRHLFGLHAITPRGRRHVVLGG
jgi:hypothetical protein